MRLTNGSDLEKSMVVVDSASPTRDRDILLTDARNVLETIAAAGSDMEYSLTRRVGLNTEGPARNFLLNIDRMTRQYGAALEVVWRQELDSVLVPGIQSAWLTFSEECDDKILAHFDGRELWASQSDAMHPVIDDATLDVSIDTFEVEFNSYVLTARMHVSCYGSLSVGTQDVNGNTLDYSQQEFSVGAEMILSIRYEFDGGIFHYEDPQFTIPVNLEDGGWAECNIRD